MKDIVEIHEFFTQGRDAESSHVLLHISEPSEDEDGKGYFFALVEIENVDEDIVSHIQKMIDDVEASYYDAEVDEKKNPFEQSIEAINRRSHTILSVTDSTLHLLFGVVEGTKVSFASRGNVQVALLYHKNNELQHINVNEEQKSTDEQIFSSLVEGEMKIDDFFVITTHPVEQYFPLDRVEKILMQKDTKSTAFHIQKILEQIDTDRSLGGILLHKPKESDIPKLGRLPKSAKPLQASLPAAKNIFSSALSEISKKMNPNQIDSTIFNPQAKPLLEPETKRRRNQKQIPRLLLALANGIALVGGALVHFFQSIIVGLLKIFRFLFILVSNRRGEREKAMHNFRIESREYLYKMKRLPLLSKLLLILACIAILVFSSSIIFMKHREKVQGLQQEYTLKIEDIKNKKDAAEASLLYGDSKKAFTLLQEAKTVNDSLATHPNKNETELQDLARQIENSLMQLRKQSNVATTLKADIASKFTGAQTTQMVRLDNTLFVFGASDHSAYQVNLDTGEIVQKNHDAIATLLTANSPKEYDKIVFTTDNAHIAEYDKTTQALAAKEIAFPNTNVNIASLFIYNRRLYTLDTANKQIYRHNQTQTGYDKGTSWITDTGIDLSNTVSITIDGDLYALKNNGEILKFSAGKIQPFSIVGLDPKLQNPSQIWTYNDVKNIYILDPASKRVVVIDKNGTLVKQYTSSDWQNPSSLVVDEGGKKIYILDSNKIFEFKL